MSLLFLQRIDAAPLSNTDFTFFFNQWLGVLVDTLNEMISNTQDAFNYLDASNYTASEINTLFTNGGLKDGLIFYDTTNELYVGKISGSLVQFTTAPYP